MTPLGGKAAFVRHVACVAGGLSDLNTNTQSGEAAKTSGEYADSRSIVSQFDRVLPKI